MRQTYEGMLIALGNTNCICPEKQRKLWGSHHAACPKNPYWRIPKAKKAVRRADDRPDNG